MQHAHRKRLAHLVYFTLKESNDEARERLIASCDRWLSNQPGVIFYGAGARGDEFTRPVNDSLFDVGLHVVFESKEAHDTYQASDDHQAFLAENRDSWAQIRVFDAYV